MARQVANSAPVAHTGSMWYRPTRVSDSGAMLSTMSRPRELVWLFAEDSPRSSRSGAPRAQTNLSKDAGDVPARMRLLVVEDDFLVGESLRLMLTELECDVIGPAPTVEVGAQLLEEHDVDAAILDISLGTESSAPLAKSLREKHCPFVFVTGYANPGDLLPEDLQDHQRFQKPIDRAQLERIVSLLSDR